MYTYVLGAWDKNGSQRGFLRIRELVRRGIPSSHASASPYPPLKSRTFGDDNAVKLRQKF